MAIAHSSYFEPPSDMRGHDIFWFAEQISARVNEHLQQGPPAGGIYHAEGPTKEGGWWAFDVWDSAESMKAFESSILAPILDEFGIKVAGTPTQLDVWWESSQPPSPQ